MQQTHCYARDTVTLLWKCYRVHRSCHQVNPTCNIAPSLRLLVPSSPHVRRQSVRMSHYHFRSKVALDLVDHVVDTSGALVTFLLLAGRYGRTQSPSATPVESIRRFWRACPWSLVSWPLLRAARSRSSGAAVATIRTLRTHVHVLPARSQNTHSYRILPTRPLVAIFQHSLPFLQSESFQIHVGTIHRRAIGPLAHHNGT
jgi:hypothetical protein